MTNLHHSTRPGTPSLDSDIDPAVFAIERAVFAARHTAQAQQRPDGWLARTDEQHVDEQAGAAARHSRTAPTRTMPRTADRPTKVATGSVPDGDRGSRAAVDQQAGPDRTAARPLPHPHGPQH